MLCKQRWCEEIQGTVTMELDVRIRTEPAGVSGQRRAKGVATGLWAGQQAVMKWN